MFVSGTWLPDYHPSISSCLLAEPDCPHPLCKIGKPDVLRTWYSGGPPITHIPLPVLDEDRPWGNTSCEKCNGFCAGHYKVKVNDVKVQSDLQSFALPPSSVLKCKFSKLKAYPPPKEDYFKQTGKKVNLTPEDTQMWMDHLDTVVRNRKRGALKAAETHRNKRLTQIVDRSKCADHTTTEDSVTNRDGTTKSTDNTTYFRGSCGKLYVEETQEVEIWIGCDLCSRWYCGKCEGLLVEPETVHYFCKNCCQHVS